MSDEANKGWMKEKWENLSPGMRRAIWVGTVAAIIFSATFSFVVSDADPRDRKRIERDDVQREIFTRASAREVNLHGLSATVTELENMNTMMRREIQALRSEVQLTPDTRGVGRDTYEAIEAHAVRAAIKKAEVMIAERTAEIERRLAQQEAGRAAHAATQQESKEKQGVIPHPAVTIETPEPEPVIADGMSANTLAWGKTEEVDVFVTERQDQRRQDTEKPLSAAGELRQITKVVPPEDPKVAASREKEEQPKDVFIPAGSIFSGTLITGLDAPTGTQARNSPFPTLLRIKKEALLPNRYRADVRECFLIASGYGDLSSERVYLRSETISCIRNDGGVIEAPIDMYASGEDGKAGVRGKLDTKQGQYLAKALAAGFLQSLASVFNTVPTATISTVAGGQTPFQQVASEEAFQSAGVRGVGDAMDRLAGFYIDMAQSVFPIVQVDAGRQVDFIMTRGMSLRLR